MPAPLAVRQIHTPVGPLTLASTDEGLCLCEFNGLRTARGLAELATLLDLREPPHEGPHPHLDLIESELTQYFAGALRAFTTPLHLPGTDFQRQVWDQLLRIPYGTTCSYQDIALRLGNTNAMRAVGLANGQNRVAIVVPCHRVIDKSGSLRGYGGGLEKKRFLLELEGAIAPDPVLFS